LIEKPIADTAANARMLVDLAKRKNTPILVGIIVVTIQR
jgi:predicted dehydrogenase